MTLREDLQVIRYSIGRHKLHRKQKDYISWYYDERPKLFQFHNIHEGEDCFIIGNGPSLNKMDLSLLNDYYTFGLNKIFLIFKRVDLRLRYYVSVNRLVIEQSLDDIKKFTCPVFLSYPNSGAHRPTKDNIFYLFTKGGTDGFQKTITESIYEGGTVTYVAMQLAFYMGFRNVYLIGVDHNFVQHGKANSEQLMHGPDVNHFDPNYFSGMKWNLADLKSSELGYTYAKVNYDFHGRSVYDATVDGNLNIFEKVRFDEALTRAKKADKPPRQIV